ncbi:ABC transporter ATP-binding protein [Rhodobium orientis]|nr:ABC transporter ATP-binding protein [Rhodobium orientis]
MGLNERQMTTEDGSVEAAAPRPARILEVNRLVHTFGDFTALNDVSLSANSREFVTLLGPSGSGKSTLLRILAGLELPTRVDALILDGHDVADVPANRRNVATVFQHYGLFPHLNVLENVEYGLRVRKVAKAERRQRALRMLEQVQLADFAHRNIAKLSGGQKQRVALARSLVLEPVILLLDEPLGALDEKLRIDMQVELLQLQRSLGMTFIYVTHSQEEALTMSDRILLMNQGRIVQEGTPEDMFDRPASRFAASFMGMENMFEAVVAEVGPETITVTADGVTFSGIWAAKGAPAAGDRVCCAFRSEKVRIAGDGAPEPGLNRIEGSLESRIYKGKYLDITYRTAIGPLRMREWDAHAVTDEAVRIEWRASQTILFPANEQ